MSKYRVLITHADIPESGLELLKPLCELVTMNVQGNEAEFLNKAKDVDGIFLFGSSKIGKDFVEKAGGRVKVIGNMGVGVDHIDVDYVKSKNIKVSNTPGTLDDCVAEVAIGLALSVGHRMKEGFNKMTKGEWIKGGPQWLLGQEIAKSNFGIIGLGNVGKAVARKAWAFSPNKLLYTGRKPKPDAKEVNAEYVSFDDLISESDFIVVCCPSTPETKHLINKSVLSKMKKNAIIINVARGEIIKQDDLYEALATNRIMGAGLDVMTPEPIDKSNPLLSLDNCVLTPHIGSATYKTRAAMAELTARNILAALEGKEMPSPL